MSINHFPSDPQETIWWTQQMETPSSIHHKNSLISQLYHHHPLTTAAATMRGQNPPLNFNLNQEDEDEPLDEAEKLSRIEGDDDDDDDHKEITVIKKEPMFEKPLTPSDVGKLNRLVIPKQHAEKYFPLGGNGAGDSVEKGLLLSFEDESGKLWRFRYSYWNSSQSYVLTKGWSRFVKEKRLDAGDIVMFERFRDGGDRFIIGCRRRNAVAPVTDSVMAQAGVVAGGGGGGVRWTRVFYSGHPYPSQLQPNGPPLPFQPECLHAGGGSAAGMQNQTTGVGGNSKTLRLFGVNMECQSTEPPIPDGSSQGQTQYQHNYSYAAHASNYHHSHMDSNFRRDVNQMRFHQG